MSFKYKNLNNEKNIFYFVAFAVFGGSACTPNFHDVPPPNCDNRTNKCTIQLDFTNATYYCNLGPYVSIQPPMATNIDYINTASSTNAITSTDKTAYLCQMNVKNDEPANTPCSQFGIGTTYWKIPGYAQTIDVFTAYNFDITVDYYEPEDQWCNKGRPYFAGTVGLPASATGTSIPMFTQPNYTP